MQHREPPARHWIVPRKATRDQTGRDLDDTGTIHLVHLRRNPVESVPRLDARARRRIDRGYDRAQQSTHGSNCVALGVWLVCDGPTRVAFRHAGSAERKPRTRRANRMGVWILLDVLVGADDSDGRGVVVMRFVFLGYLAGGWTTK